LNPIIVIPARMASKRLPGKPLADIHGTPMVVHVLRQAEAAALGPVVVACAEREVAEAVARAGGRAVLTAPDLPSGSDRVRAALAEVDPERRHDAVVNLQGDRPEMPPEAIRAALEPLSNPEVDIGTIAYEITEPAEREDADVVKAVIALAPGARLGRALYFSRLPAPGGAGAMYHHEGIYAFRREALERFVALAPGALEQREDLEQLRALEAGMRIEVALVDSIPRGVDTPADLERARARIARKS
jgi:3-deoxy-manno-octulosonate cytidylyltransferase (CMP-KDO synthetase)